MVPSVPPRRSIRVATRGSRLALWQAQAVADLLGLEAEIMVIRTEGDKTQAQNVPLESMRGRAVFAKEVESAVLSGEADIAVHSAKDLASQTVPGLLLACVPKRSDPRDTMLGTALEDLPAGATVATGAVRRRAQLASLRPDLTFTGLRGNVDTRAAKSKAVDAAVMAHAALQRLGDIEVTAHPLSISKMLPQAGQGALGVECRIEDSEMAERLAAVEDQDSRRCVDAERAFLAALGGGCDLPAGAYAELASGQIHLRAMLASLDGRIVLQESGFSDDPSLVGAALAERLLNDHGGARLLFDSLPDDQAPVDDAMAQP